MSICTAPIYRLKELNNLFIELTAKNCNQRCNKCYIDFPINNKSVKDFISIDIIKDALNDTKNENLYCIYLTGAEPMTHPEFNTILRLCLKRCNVCICTNSFFLNEKKIRFLKKVEEEVQDSSQAQIFFKLSVAHYNEIESDKVRYRGSFRQTISALKILSGYNFNTVLSVHNFYKLSELELKENFAGIFAENNISNTELQINSSYPENSECDKILKNPDSDCTNSRILTAKGIYACPFLANDYRGRMGASFKDYSKTVTAETDFCTTCATNKGCMFAIE